MITFPVREVLFATPRARGISLDLGDQAFLFSAGQAVMVGLNGSPLRKPYSIASAPWEVAKTGVMQLLIQIDDSALDPHLERATPGTRVDVEGPFGTFGLPAGQSEPLLFVAGGTGIAPLRSMLMERLLRGGAAPAFAKASTSAKATADRSAGQAISVIYSARSPEEFAFRSELDALEKAGRITAHFTVTRDEGGAWPGRRGRIDHALVEKALPSPEARCLICGPPPLVTDTSELLVRLGVKRDRILTEQY
ncbi:MAG: FAD-binding oxidoreductase [Acidobacteriota bacterium]|nr:FAD-binding oxidoreductase [Acidobacteriota bacterium]